MRVTIADCGSNAAPRPFLALISYTDALRYGAGLWQFVRSVPRSQKVTGLDLSDGRKPLRKSSFCSKVTEFVVAFCVHSQPLKA